MFTLIQSPVLGMHGAVGNSKRPPTEPNLGRSTVCLDQLRVDWTEQRHKNTEPGILIIGWTRETHKLDDDSSL